jgi:hypothetical protein
MATVVAQMKIALTSIQIIRKTFVKIVNLLLGVHSQVIVPRVKIAQSFFKINASLEN